jgi:hypothetical protein
MTTESLESRLEPFRRTKGRDCRIVWVSDLEYDLFTWTQDLPSPPWPDFSLQELSALNAPMHDVAGLKEWFNSRPPVKEVLDVALVLAFMEGVPVLDERHEWLALAHQTGGVSCTRHEMVALRLEARPEVAAHMKHVAVERYGSDLTTGWSMSLSALRGYGDAIAPLGLNCEYSYRHLGEGFYPADLPRSPLWQKREPFTFQSESQVADAMADDIRLAQELVDRLAVDAPRLADLGGEPKPYGGFLNRAILAWLAPNSD